MDNNSTRKSSVKGKERKKRGQDTRNVRNRKREKGKKWMSSRRYLTILPLRPKIVFFVARYRSPFLAQMTVYPGSRGYDIRNGRNMWSIIIGPFHPSTINPSSLSRQSLYKHDPLLLPCFARHQQRLSSHRATPLSIILVSPSPSFSPSTRNENIRHEMQFDRRVLLYNFTQHCRSSKRRRKKDTIISNSLFIYQFVIIAGFEGWLIDKCLRSGISINRCRLFLLET